jgi:glutamyl-tRNA synthetase
MSEKKVRVRFAPSPTGGLHLGGVRTALFNYLFARKHGGHFILRIEDTDQTRFVEGAEAYILQCLKWCGIEPDESPEKPGSVGPYRQSERKELYRKYAEQLVEAGQAYYAFDTTESLAEERKKDANFKYGVDSRLRLVNSLSLSESETVDLMQNGHPYVVRIKMPEQEIISFNDMIRGEVQFESALMDDKVLLKADGMPTYHLAVVIDDYLMGITHAFRGEEWLPSAPVHILLWRWLFGEHAMPKWAHLPLILKPDGNGKLSKRDGDRLGFPVYAMNWTDPRSGEFTAGFKENGYLPQAFVNMLATLGWNDGSGREIFSLEELEKSFSIERLHKAGARFDIEKAKWFNQEWIRSVSDEDLAASLIPYFETSGIAISNLNFLKKVVRLVKDRCSVLPDFLTQAGFFFQAPTHPNVNLFAAKWNENKTAAIKFWSSNLDATKTAADWEESFKENCLKEGIKPGEMMLPLRIMLVGDKFGPGVFEIALLIGVEETKQRIDFALAML